MKLKEMRTESLYMNVILILTSLGILASLFTLIVNLFNLKIIFNSPLPSSTISMFVFNILNIIILSIYLFKLYLIPSKRVIWTDITFGYLGFGVILTRILYVLETKAKISLENAISNSSSFISHSVSLQVFTGIGILLILGIVWYTFRKHLKKRGLEGDK